ncbi:hypothetical protein ACJJTC_008852 [Scirpophaga incertulas]
MPLWIIFFVLLPILGHDVIGTTLSSSSRNFRRKPVQQKSTDGQFDLYKIGSGLDTKKLSSPVQRDEESEFGLQRAETGDRRLSQNNVASSDLRAAHSSDFFSGQRDRGRDDPTPAKTLPQSSHSHARQSFRRPPTTRAPIITTQYTNPPSPPQPSSPPQYDHNSKRKLIRKRPVHQTTSIPQSTFSQNTQPPQYSEQPQHNFNRRVPQNRQTVPPVNIPPQYKEFKDEYVEVSRVTPKPNKLSQSSPSAPFSQKSHEPNNFNQKDRLVELYNFESQSTPGLNAQKDNRPVKVRNNYNINDDAREPDLVRLRNGNTNNNNKVRIAPNTVNYSTSPNGVTSTPALKNFNSVSYESEKNNFVSYSKQNYFTNPTTTISTSIHTTARPEPPAHLNTLAYNTNLGFNTPLSNYAESDEDDGQYRPPQGEDDGQYRPELYDRELLSGAHSLNIAASGNRLPEDQKPRGKTQAPYKPVSQTAVPRPFRPAPTPSSPSTYRVPEQTYPTTLRSPTPSQPQSQRTFDYIQTYTTTSRPKLQSHDLRRAPHHRQHYRQLLRGPPPARHISLIHLKTKKMPATTYAYYDSDPGFSEYDNIEEFGRTKTKA